jgi:hypothetical protein
MRYADRPWPGNIREFQKDEANSQMQRQPECAGRMKQKSGMRALTSFGSVVFGLVMLVSLGFADEGGKHGGKSTHMKDQRCGLEGGAEVHYGEDDMGIPGDYL